MRRVLPFLLLGAALGVGLSLLLTERPGRELERSKSPAELELEANPHLTFKTSHLVVRARTAEGKVPRGTQVGYEREGAVRDPEGTLGPREEGESRLVSVDAEGTAAFEAPLGRLWVVARAPGYRDARQPIELLAGIAEEKVLVLEPED